MPWVAPGPRWDCHPQGPAEAQARRTGEPAWSGEVPGVCGLPCVFLILFARAINLPSSSPWQSPGPAHSRSEVPSPSPLQSSLTGLRHQPCPRSGQGHRSSSWLWSLSVLGPLWPPWGDRLGLPGPRLSSVWGQKGTPRGGPASSGETEWQMAQAAGPWNLAASEAQVICSGPGPARLLAPPSADHRQTQLLPTPAASPVGPSWAALKDRRQLC